MFILILNLCLAFGNWWYFWVIWWFCLEFSPMCNSVAQPITPRRLMPQEEYDLKVIITFKSNIFLPKIANYGCFRNHKPRMVLKLNTYLNNLFPSYTQNQTSSSPPKTFINKERYDNITICTLDFFCLWDANSVKIWVNHGHWSKWVL